MRSKDNAPNPGRDDDAEDPEHLGLDGDTPGSESGDPVIDADLGVDEDLIDVELGEREGEFHLEDDSAELDEVDPEDAEDDDDREMTLLHELGIDLDAPDGPSAELDVDLELGEDDAVDDDAAA